MRSLPKLNRSLVCTLAVLSLASTSFARNIGALETPLEVAKSSFATATESEPEVRVISRARSKEITALLPDSLHFHELGKRVVYSVFREELPLGLMHVRHENGEWGLIKIAWHLNLDLTIRDFTILSCREPERERVESAEFRELLRSKNLQELRQLKMPEHKLSQTILGSAIKSLAATQVGWSLVSSKLRMREAAGLRFPEATSTVFREVPNSPAVLAALEEHRFAPICPAVRNGILLAQCSDEHGTVVGTLVHIRIELEERSLQLLFTVAGTTLTHSEAMTRIPDETLQAEVTELSGKTLKQLAAMNSPLPRAGGIAICMALHGGGNDED